MKSFVKGKNNVAASLVFVLSMSCLCLVYVLSVLSMSCLCLVYVLSMSCLCLVYVLSVLSMSCLCLVLTDRQTYIHTYRQTESFRS